MRRYPSSKVRSSGCALLEHHIVVATEGVPMPSRVSLAGLLTESASTPSPLLVQPTVSGALSLTRGGLASGRLWNLTAWGLGVVSLCIGWGRGVRSPLASVPTPAT